MAKSGKAKREASRQRARQSHEHVGADRLSELLNKSVKWVRSHAADLGGYKNDKGHWVFPLARAIHNARLIDNRSA